MQITQNDACDPLFQLINLSCSKEALSEYLAFIYRDLVGRCQKTSSNLNGLLFSTFASYMNLPLFVSEKLFQTLDVHEKKYLTEKEFVCGLVTIYKGSTSQVISLISSVLDFDQDGDIQFQDASLLLSYLHLVKIETRISMIKEIILNFFSGGSAISTRKFEEKSAEVNSDVIMLFLYYFIINKPFHVDTIIYLGKIIHNDNAELYVRRDNKSRLSLPSPSLALEIFLSYTLKYAVTPEQPLVSDMKLLEDFEKDFHDASSLIVGQGLVQNETTENSSRLLNSQMKYKDDYFIYPCSPVIQTSAADSSPEIIEPKEIVAYRSFDHYIKKYKLKLFQDEIFCYTYDKKNEKEELEWIMNLKFSIIDKCEGIEVKGKKLFPFQINANHDFQLLAWNFLCEEKKAMEHFVENVRQAIKYRSFGQHYELVSKIGAGQFGEVMLGVNKVTKEKVAVKTIKKSQITEKIANMVRWEIDIFKFLQKVNHPGIIRAIEYFESRNTIYLVFELMNVGNLNEYLYRTDGILCSELFKNITLQVMNALDFLYSYGIVHRDLKPENILIHEHENCIQVKLIDFGLSKVMGVFDKAREAYGSLCYSAPEILIGNYHNHKVDVWSFGVIVYYIHYAKLPFDHSNSDLASITNKIILGKLEFETSSADVTEEEEASIQAFIRACLIQKMSDRLTIRQILEAGLLYIK